MTRLPGRAALCALLVTVPIAAGCSSSGGGGLAPLTTTGPVAPAGPVVTRWWSNSANVKSSVIDASDPTAAAAKLHPSRADYCGMLRQTVHSRRTILSGAEPDDPAFAVATDAFVAEITKVAPAAVGPSWHVLGGALLALVHAAGDVSKVHGVHPHAVSKASRVIARDARRQCRVNVSGRTKVTLR